MAGVTNANARSTSIDAYLTSVADNIYKSGALSDAIGKACPTLGKIPKETWDGGRSIDVNIMYDFTTGFTGLSPWDPISLTGSDGITQAIYKPAEYALPIAIDGPQLRSNMGKGKLVDLVKTKFAQAEMTQKNKFSQHIHDVEGISTTTTGGGGKNIIPIPMIVSSANTIYPGGINPATYTWWDNPRLAADETTEAAAATTYKTYLDKIDAAGLLAAKYMGGMPNLVTTDLRTYRMVIRALREKQQIVESTSGEGGFHGIKIGSLGGAELYWEEHMPDITGGYNWDNSSWTNGTMYFLNTAFLKLMVRSGMDWKPSPFESLLPRQDVSASAILWEGQLVCTNRLKNSVLTKIVPATSS